MFWPMLFMLNEMIVCSNVNLVTCAYMYISLMIQRDGKITRLKLFHDVERELVPHFVKFAIAVEQV
jgi:hypothetical protein